MENLLFICSGAIDRSPCAASLFDDSKTHEARFAGVGPLTETPVTKELIDWADKIFVMENEHKKLLLERFPDIDKEIVVLDVSNDFLRYDLELERILRHKLYTYLE